MPGASLLSGVVASAAASGIAGSAAAAAGVPVAAGGAVICPVLASLPACGVGCLRSTIHGCAAWKGRFPRQRRRFASTPSGASAAAAKGGDESTSAAASAPAGAAVGKRNGATGRWWHLSRLQKLDKAKGAALAMTHFGVVAFGIVVIGTLTYAVGSELFSPDSSTSLYSDALERVRKNPQAQAVIGTPIAGFGRVSRRRATRPAYQYTSDDAGREHMLLMFYIKGPLNRGTAFLDCIKNEQDHWVFESLYVDVPDSDQPAKRIVIVTKPQQGAAAGGTGGLLGSMARRMRSLWGSTHSIPKPEPRRILE